MKGVDRALVAIVLLAGLLQPQHAEAQPRLDTAAIAARRGDTKTAASLVRSRLAKAPKDPSALFVLACFRLDAGDFQGARAAAKRLAAVVPESPEAKVLPYLVEERASNPTGQWPDAFIAAYNRARVPGAEPTIFGELSTRAPLSSEKLLRAETPSVFSSTTRFPARRSRSGCFRPPSRWQSKICRSQLLSPSSMFSPVIGFQPPPRSSRLSPVASC